MGFRSQENLETEYGIAVRDYVGMTRQSKTSDVSTIEQFRTAVAIPYINTLTQNIKNRFANKEVSISVAVSVFNPAQIPDSSQDSFSWYGNEEMKLLATFYGEEVEVTHSSNHRSV